MSTHDHDNDDGVFGARDPFAANPDAEFAPTQAMSAIPAGELPPLTPNQPESVPPATQVPPGGGQKPNFAAGQRRPAPTTDDSPGIGKSTIATMVGALLLLSSFFLATFNLPAFFEDDGMDNNLGAIFMLGMAADSDLVEDDEKEAFETAQAIVEAIGYDEFVKATSSAETEEEYIAALEDYNVSLFQLARLFQIADFNSDVFGETSARVNDEDRAGMRIIWLSMSWIAIVAIVALLMALIRGLKPMNALQVAWSGLFGLVYLLMATGLVLAASETKSIGPATLSVISGPGPGVMGFGALVMWISAFTALTSKNWWKAPLIAIGLILLTGGVIAGPAFLLL